MSTTITGHQFFFLKSFIISAGSIFQNLCREKPKCGKGLPVLLGKS